MQTDALDIADTSPQDWKYISEGGSTIVFSYVGPPNTLFDRTALRLRKGPVVAHSDPDKHQEPQLAEPSTLEDRQTSKNAPADPDEPDDPTIVFQRTVIEQLMPIEHLPRLQSVHVARAWLEELAERTEPLRPPQRRAKDTIDRGRRKAVLATDLVGGAGCAVEIKPKWGFLPKPTYLSEETRAIKTRTCRFCMHAHMKSTQGEDVALGYCPLDLYSGDATRVEKALRALWDVWIGTGGKVNNLKVFVEGKIIKPRADLTSLAPLTAQLFPTSANPDPAYPLDALRSAFINTLLPLLLHTPVLHTLSTLQRTLDALDIEGLAALWARMYPTIPLGTGPAAHDPDMAEWARFVSARAARGNQSSDVVPETQEELHYRVAAYLLGASFKDCSIILRMPPRAAADAGVGEKGTVTVIDLDVKGVDRLPKWAALDREIVDAYRGVVPRECVDAHYGGGGGAVPLA
ncbi:inositol-pentakisphosphate 2-kinase [Trametes versicolor FP-101664 SS1]|uniref:inositol-pentakisphosphate 2-kinase n=1 Tax=Trametes versicolor (strain FP-101664) TaxID=717944 RepID=UPI00046231A5|nr:inositol-pentakisphosphate 2-kinase [Trametes versicolor FP-101664 SS1]EIW60279.1 inositol-pentakisphosphate 2-kinase [Trametes versicolor FP-101664 SS1]